MITVLLILHLMIAASLVGGSRWEPSSVPASARPAKVLIVGIPKLGWPDVGTGRMPTVDRLASEGAIAAASVRTKSLYPNTDEAYAIVQRG